MDGRTVAAIAGLAVLTLGVSLGGSSRLSYHEAISAQAARELIAGGSVLVPTIDGRPWLEKPPLAIWAIALAGRALGAVDTLAARLPSALGALGLALGIAAFAARRFGPPAGLLAGLVQIATSWTVARGRLAEGDILLGALVAWALVAFDRIRLGDVAGGRRWFFALLGATSLVKGIGFGAALVVAVVAVVLIWDRDRATFRALLWPAGWLMALALALAWPVAVLARHPAAFDLWFHHVADRFAPPKGTFAGESWPEYGLAPLAMLLPWTPLAIAGGRRALDGPRGGGRLLVAWAVVPAVLVSLARARNAHYLVPALAPWSVGAALGLIRLGERLAGRGWSAAGLRRLALGGFLGLGLLYAAGYTWLGPRLDRRGREWAFYEDVGRIVPAGEPLVLLYDDWDRLPYATPFGPVPHDLPVRLFSLGRPALWRESPVALRADPPPLPFAVIGRDRDLEVLQNLGDVATLARGPKLRQPASRVDDREFVLFRVGPGDERRAGRTTSGIPPGSRRISWTDCADCAD